MRSMIGMALIGLGALAIGLARPVAAGEPDPWKSPVWDYMVASFFEGAEYRFDERVVVSAPLQAQDSTQVPVSVSVEGLPDVQEILVFVDQNPLPKAAQFYPVKARPYLGLRVKMNEASAIHAAARTLDGVWHVGGIYVDAPGGGCIAPRVELADGDWDSRLGEVRGQAWRKPDGSERLRIQVMHPMDTGLVNNVPPFFLESLTISTAEGEVLGRLMAYEPVSANPAFTLEVTPGRAAVAGYRLDGRDNNGNLIKAVVPPGIGM